MHVTQCLSTHLEEDPFGCREGKVNVRSILTKGALSGYRPNLSLLQVTRLLQNPKEDAVSCTPPHRRCLGSRRCDRRRSRCSCCSPRPLLAHEHNTARAAQAASVFLFFFFSLFFIF